jgi:flavin reductase (DIM6/NTAB) family NADH-FMN oxidoreductase RutF
MFASTSAKEDQGDTKDSVANIRETGVFCVNIVSEALTDAMNISAGLMGKDEDEFVAAGLEKAECDTIACSRVAAAPANLECKLTQIIQLPGEANFAVFGEVTGIHMRDDCMTDGLFDVTRFNPLSRLGYRDYTVIRDTFTLKRPGE